MSYNEQGGFIVGVTGGISLSPADFSLSAGTMSFADIIGVAGTYVHPTTIEVNAKGRIVAISSVPSVDPALSVAGKDAMGAVTTVNLNAPDLTLSLGLLELSLVPGVAGVYTNPTSVTIDTKGRITAVSSTLSVNPAVSILGLDAMGNRVVVALNPNLQLSASVLGFTPLPVYNNDAAAGGGGLASGRFYRTPTGDVKQKL